MNINTVFYFALSAALFYCCKGSNQKNEANSPLVISQPKNDSTGPGDVDYMAIGKNIAMETQAVLAKNLIGSISNGGTAYAIEFCNSGAIHLTDSMAKVLEAGIKRVSDKPRNPTNLANEMESAHIQLVKQELLKGEVPGAKLVETRGKMIGYYPIITNAMCLQCHGKKNSDIKLSTLQKVEKLYPNDMATGYNSNELRGLWVVEMKIKNTTQ